MRKKKRTIIFGAGAAGINAYHSLKNKYKVICFADNDVKKQGELLLGLPIISADDINKHLFDIVHIASIYQYQILTQLVDKGIVTRSKIEIVPKDDILGKRGLYYLAFFLNFSMTILLALFFTALVFSWFKQFF